MNWLDIIPAISLASGVPVTRRGDPEDYANHGVVIAPDTCPRVFYPMHAEPQVVSRWDEVRVDLDDPQGFAYALRCLFQQVSYRDAQRLLGFPIDEEPVEWWSWSAPLWPDFLRRERLGNTTDADRLALARALAEVS